MTEGIGWMNIIDAELCIYIGRFVIFSYKLGISYYILSCPTISRDYNRKTNI